MPGQGAEVSSVLLLMELLRAYTQFLLHLSSSGTFPSITGSSEKPKKHRAVSGFITPNPTGNAQGMREQQLGGIHRDHRGSRG